MIYILFLMLILSVLAAIIASLIVIGMIAAEGIPFISTSNKDFKAIMEAVEAKPNELIYDLGCGKAHLLTYAEKNYNTRGIGYEISVWPYLMAIFNLWYGRYKKTEVHFSNMYKADLSKADIVFCYLFPETMDKLHDKFVKEMKPGSRVVTYGFALKRRQADKVVITNQDNTELNRIFVYKF